MLGLRLILRGGRKDSPAQRQRLLRLIGKLRHSQVSGARRRIRSAEVNRPVAAPQLPGQLLRLHRDTVGAEELEVEVESGQGNGFVAGEGWCLTPPKRHRK